MSLNSRYGEQVRLLVQVLPHVATEPCFALKGGTAINLFVRDMPRLSVDIDLAYVTSEPRQRALANARDALSRISEKITRGLPGATARRRAAVDAAAFTARDRAGQRLAQHRVATRLRDRVQRHRARQEILQGALLGPPNLYHYRPDGACYPHQRQRHPPASPPVWAALVTYAQLQSFVEKLRPVGGFRSSVSCQSRLFAT